MSNNNWSSCPVCGDQFPPVSGGRPRLYCSNACARAAASEARRLDRRIERLESQLDDIAADHGSAVTHFATGQSIKQRRAAIRRKLKQLRKRQIELFNNEGSKSNA